MHHSQDKTLLVEASLSCLKIYYYFSFFCDQRAGKEQPQGGSISGLQFEGRQCIMGV